MLLFFSIRCESARFHADKYYEESEPHHGSTIGNGMRPIQQGREKVKKRNAIRLPQSQFEFERKGLIAFDELLRQTDAKLVKMEMDIGWVASTAMIRRLSEKYPTVRTAACQRHSTRAPSRRGGEVQLNSAAHNRLEESLRCREGALDQALFRRTRRSLPHMPDEAIKVDYEFVSNSEHTKSGQAAPLRRNDAHVDTQGSDRNVYDDFCAITETPVVQRQQIRSTKQNETYAARTTM